ncbi:MAG TPA: amidase family protein, partial [Alphaproteobacteria bacterium]|nr:amidase family protein [Alphaproteobacteria bacterium]
MSAQASWQRRNGLGAVRRSTANYGAAKPTSQQRETDLMSDPTRLTALDAAQEIAAGRLTSEKLVQSLLERIEERDGAVLAWAHLDPEQALAEARERDRERPRSLLHGVPVGVKDILDTHDMPTECGSPIYKGNRPASDAACVAMLRAAG